MPETVKCPFCKVELEEKSVVECKDGGTDVMALCPECLRTWQWHRDADGKMSDIEQYFFG